MTHVDREWLPWLRSVGLTTLVAAQLLVTAGSAPEAPPSARPVPGAVTVPVWSSAEILPPKSRAPVPAAPADLPVIDYAAAVPPGFPADPQPMSTDPLTEGLHPTERLAAYDAPGGRPIAFLAPTIGGVALTVPVVGRRLGFTAVLLPSANRTIGWLPPHGWTTAVLRDQIVIRRGAHKLSWYRDGRLVHTWSVGLGTAGTPTPLGRTFVIARTTLPGRVYAGVDVLALGAIPDDPSVIPLGLRGAHIGIHAWYNPIVFGGNFSDGCVHTPKSAQQILVRELAPGTEVVVLD